MAYQQKEGQGSLFKNDKQNDRQPDFKGTLMIKGVLYEVAAWNRTSQNGRSYISLQAEEKRTDGQQGGGRPWQGQSGQSSSGNASHDRQQVPPPGIGDMPDDLEDLPF